MGRGRRYGGPEVYGKFLYLLLKFAIRLNIAPSSAQKYTFHSTSNWSEVQSDSLYFKGRVAAVLSLHQGRLMPRREIHGSTNSGAARTSDIVRTPPRQRADTQRSNPRSWPYQLCALCKLLDLCEPVSLRQ